MVNKLIHVGVFCFLVNSTNIIKDTDPALQLPHSERSFH